MTCSRSLTLLSCRRAYRTRIIAIVVDAVLCVLAKATLHACSTPPAPRARPAPPPASNNILRADPSTPRNGAGKGGAGAARQGRRGARHGGNVERQRRRGRREDTQAILKMRGLFRDRFSRDFFLRRLRSLGVPEPMRTFRRDGFLLAELLFGCVVSPARPQGR